MGRLTVNEEMFLIAILHLNDEAYGVKIRKKITDLTGITVFLGTLYNTLEQLIRKGFVSTRKGEPTSQRGGHNKVYYSLTDDGIKALEDARELHEKLWGSLPNKAFGK
ncbi:MAG: PadR family transcriptional regulator [bacterium]|nr:PadR family transcriptional regulator [bacterium]